MAEIVNKDSCQEEETKIKRNRGCNFSPSEIMTLIEEYKKVKSGIEGTKVPNSAKNEMWAGIAHKVSEVGTAYRSAQDINLFPHRSSF